MIKEIREHLGLTQEEIAGYLQLSVEMVRSIELGRRQIPLGDKLDASFAILKAIHDRMKSGPVNDPVLADHQIKLMKRVVRKYRYKIDQFTNELKDMRQSYSGACFNLDVYQLLAQALTPAQNEEDAIRLTWITMMIAEAQQCIHDNSTAVQNLLAAKIAGLKNMVESLEISDPFRPTMQDDGAMTREQ